MYVTMKRGQSPLFYCLLLMINLIEKISGYAHEVVDGTEYFVVDVIQSKKGGLISVLLDGDEGIPIQKCTEVNRHVSQRIDEEIPDDVGAFVVEVSSPGVDRPLKLERQFPKHIGRNLSFEDAEGNKVEGKLLAVKDGNVDIEQEYKEKGKKKQILTKQYSLTSISNPVVVVSFK